MKNPLKRGVVTFVFDDGYQKVFDNALPILERHGMVGVFALPLDGTRLEKSEHRKVKKPQQIRPWRDWLAIQENGHEIAAHSATHTDLTKISDSELEHELKTPKEVLQVTTFVYPGGAHDNRVVAQTRKYYTVGRTVKRGFEALPPANPYRLKTFNFSRNNFTVWKANLFTVWAWVTNSWLIETYHMIDGGDSEMVHTVKTKDFTRHVRFISFLPIHIKTIREVISS